MENKPETDTVIRVTLEGDDHKGEAIRLNEIHLEDPFPAYQHPELIQAIHSMERVFKQEIQCLCKTVSGLAGKNQQRTVSVTGLSTADSQAALALERHDSVSSKTHRVRVHFMHLSFYIDWNMYNTYS